tara:strand:- start:317 stop:1159 length:843 start_codon:yes stop_codon:yes gene_type:complete
MIKYKVIPNYINQKECENLINDAENILNKFGNRQILSNKRELVQSSSLEFREILKKSKSWIDLHNKISSQDFLNECLKILNVNFSNLELTNFFSPKNKSQHYEDFKKLLTKKVSHISVASLVKILIYKIYRSFIRILKFSFTSRYFVELLYDFSKAQNGYKREIHRDSDSRTLVFLLYLNNLSSNALGGELNLYEYGKHEAKIPSFPNIENCKVIESIKPKEGTLVIFLNTSDSFHSVTEMSGHSDYRYFLYGSYTLLGKKNPFIKNNLDKLKTEFYLFD